MVRIGMIGAGFFSQVVHLYAIDKIKQCQIVALAEGREKMCAAVAEQYRIPQIFNTYEAMLSEVKLDAAVISLPRPCLGPATLKCLEAGIPVLSEKPMAQTVKDAKRLVEAATANHIPYYVGLMRRSDAGVMLFKEKLHEWIHEGHYGPIQHVMMHNFCGEYGTAIPAHIPRGEKANARYPAWQTAPDHFPEVFRKDYEYTTNVLVHDLNLLRHVFDQDFKPQAFHVTPGISQAAILASEQFSVSLNVGPAAIGKWDQVLTAYFNKGRLSLHLPSPLARQELAYVEEATAAHTVIHRPDHKTEKWAFEKQIEFFVDALQGKPTPLSTGADSLKDLEMIEALWQHMSL